MSVNDSVSRLEASSRLEAILGSTADILWDIDLETEGVWWGEGMQSTFGYRPEQVGPSTKWCHEHIHPEDR
jgi:PAS domain-containing protein